MKNIFDIVTALPLFILGLFIAWFTFAFAQVTRPVFGPPPWSYWLLPVAGGILSGSAVALFRWHRPAAIIGSLTSLVLAFFFIPTQLPNIQTPSEYGGSICLSLAGTLVFLRFARPLSRSVAIA